MTAPVVLHTARLVLRPRRVEESAVYHRLWAERDPRVPAHRRLDAEGRPAVADIAAALRAEVDSAGPGLLAVELRDTGGVVGYCGLTFGGNAPGEEPELAFELLAEAQGRGYATEAAGAVVAWAREAGHPRLWAGVWEWNAPSRRVLAKLSFVEHSVLSRDPQHGASLLTLLRFTPSSTVDLRDGRDQLVQQPRSVARCGSQGMTQAVRVRLPPSPTRAVRVLTEHRSRTEHGTSVRGVVITWPERLQPDDDPDPGALYPDVYGPNGGRVTGPAPLVFLRPLVRSPLTSVGDYTYFADPDPTTFERENVLFHYGPGRLVIGRFCAIAREVRFLMGAANHQMGLSTFPFPMFGGSWLDAMPTMRSRDTRGDLTIGSDVWIGARATLLAGVSVGHGAIVGAEAVVSDDVPPYAVVAGNPARVVRHRLDATTREQMLDLAWWDWPVPAVTEAVPALMGGDLDGLREVARRHDLTVPGPAREKAGR